MNGFDGALSGLRLQAVERRLRKKGATHTNAKNTGMAFNFGFTPAASAAAAA